MIISRKQLILGFIALLTLFPSVLAQEYTTKQCLGNYTLEKNMTYYLTSYTGLEKNFTLAKDVFCPFGCDSTSLECSYDPFLITVGLFVVLAGFILLVAWAIKGRRR